MLTWRFEKDPTDQLIASDGGVDRFSIHLIDFDGEYVYSLYDDDGDGNGDHLCNHNDISTLAAIAASVYLARETLVDDVNLWSQAIIGAPKWGI